MLRSLIGVTRATNSKKQNNEEENSDAPNNSEDCGRTGPISLRFFRASPLPHRCVSPLPHHRAAAPFHARADDDDDADDDNDSFVCPDVETTCQSRSTIFQTSRTCKFFGSRRWETPKQIGNTLWAPWVAPESHVGPAVEGRHWDSTKTAVGSRSRVRTRPARRLHKGKVSPYTKELFAGLTPVSRPEDSPKYPGNTFKPWL